MTPDKESRTQAETPVTASETAPKATPRAPVPDATSEPVNVTRTLEEAYEAGYLGAIYDDADYTVSGVIA